MAHLQEDGLPALGTFIKPGMIVVAKIGKSATYDKKTGPTALEIHGRGVGFVRRKYGHMWINRSVYAAPGESGRVSAAYFINKNDYSVAIVEIETSEPSEPTKAEIPASITLRLNDPSYRRTNQDAPALEAALKTALPLPCELFCIFYKTYRGPFHSHKTSYELLDLTEDDENVISMTAQCRTSLAFPQSALVLTSLNGAAVLVYDTISGKVFDVDLEGGDQLFRNDLLTPRWNSFEEFIMFYFQPKVNPRSQP